MLSVRGLTVEVGGTLVVEGAAFTVRAGDRVGLVGRNGAGKTSLLKVLGGMAEPKAGSSSAPRRSATCPRTRGSTASRPTRTASPTCSAAAASTSSPPASRSCA